MQNEGSYESLLRKDDLSIGAYPALSSYITTIFEDYKNARLPYEEIWEEIWYNFLGQYNEKTTTRFKEGQDNRSRIFIKVTQLKCHTAHAKITSTHQQGIPFGFLPVGTLEDTQLDAAREIIDRRVKFIKNYFREHRINEVFSDAILSLAIFGTAILKAPVIKYVKEIFLNKTYSSENDILIDPATNPYKISYRFKKIMTVEEVPIWEFFFDPHSRDTESSIGVIQFKRLLPAQFRQFAMRPDFNKEAVEESIHRANIDAGDDVDKTRIQLGDNYMGKSGDKDKKVSYLEWWGLTPVGMLREYFKQFKNDFSKKYLDDLKVSLNLMGKRPFYVCQYKTRPNSVVGTGVAELMRDSQKMINTSMRMTIDNKAMSGNGMIGINHNAIDWSRTKRPEMYPRKIWYTKGSVDPNQAIKEIKVSDVTQGLLDLMGVFLRFADEETALPKFTSGEQDSFMNKTATGISILLQQANLNLRTVQTNIDDKWVEPIIDMFDKIFQVEGKYPPNIDIPLKVKSLGLDNLMAKEIKLEGLMKFLQITQLPQDSMFVNRIDVMREIARILDVTEFVKSKEETEEIMRQLSEIAQRQSGGDQSRHRMLAGSKIFTSLSPNEQDQMLKNDFDINPDPNRINMKRVTPEENVAALQAANELAGGGQGV
jgi:hypothetical protein